jgi:hypothetical protein
LAIFATALVIALPALLVAVIVPRGGLLEIAASALTAVALSSVFAAAGAAFWKRRPASRDIVFADLMLWGWLRRCWTERRLTRARELYESARKAGASVDIDLLTTLSGLLQARDRQTHGHGQRVARHAGRIARAMHLSPVEIAKIRTAAVVHDVGKLHTPREILNNPGRLTDAEFAVIMRHPAEGAHMLVDAGDPEIAAMVRHHHERLDGHGYPDGLSGSEIPLGARIIAVADTFDAITSSRTYKSAGTQKHALEILTEEGGSQLDPEAVAAFVGCYSSRRSVAWWALAGTVPQRVLEGLRTLPSTVGIGSGAATILPAIGAAGLLALSHGVRENTLAEQRPGAAVTVAQQTQTAPVTASAQGASRTGGASTTVAGAHGGGQIGSAVRSLRRAAQSRQPSSPTVPGEAPGVSGTAKPGPSTGGPGTTGGAPPSGAGAPPTPPRGTAPVAAPPEPAPPVSSVPVVSNPPVSVPGTPVTLPSAPVVSTPPVSLPSVSTPSVNTPPVTVGGVTVPSVTVPKVEVPTVSVPRLG